MTQTTGRFFDELGKLITDTAGAAQGVRKEVESVVRAQAENILRELDIVQREEFEAVKAMAQKGARGERAAQAARGSARRGARGAGSRDRGAADAASDPQAQVETKLLTGVQELPSRAGSESDSASASRQGVIHNYLWSVHSNLSRRLLALVGGWTRSDI